MVLVHMRTALPASWIAAYRVCRSAGSGCKYEILFAWCGAGNEDRLHLSPEAFHRYWRIENRDIQNVQTKYRYLFFIII
ncbi:MAG: hypothetical protein QOF19_2805 [Alphaproteobacteria bacterium]|jgi:hypothetical protein|nr:hypothetical protein [Alphaproteobacteria bacterium]